MPRLNRKESRALTREKLLASARRAFASLGFAAASVDEIAEGADHSKGAFYSHFDSKEDILLEILRDHMDQEIAEIRALVEHMSDQDARPLDNWIQSFHHDADWSLLAVELALHARRDTKFAITYDKIQATHQRALAELLSLFFTRTGRQLPGQSGDIALIFKALAYGLSPQNRPRSAGRRIDPGKLLRMVMVSFLCSAEKNALK